MKMAIFGIALAILGIGISVVLVLPNALNFIKEISHTAVIISPRNIIFSGSDWSDTRSFSVSNNLSSPAYNTYIWINIGNAKAEDFNITAQDLSSEQETQIPNTSVALNYSGMQFNLTGADGKDYILLKLTQLDPNETLSFSITSSSTASLKLSVLAFSQEDSNVYLQNRSQTAILFEVPENAPQQTFQLKSMTAFLRKVP